MSILWTDGVQKCDIDLATSKPSNLNPMWYESISTGPTLVAGITSPYAYNFTQNTWMQKTIPNKAQIFIGIRFKVTASSSTGVVILSLWDSATKQVQLRIGKNSTNTLTLENTSGSAYSGADQVITGLIGAWHYLCLRIKIDPSAGEAECYLDGASLFNLSGLNTRGSANSQVNGVRFGEPNNQAGGPSQICDIVITDTTSPNNAIFSDAKVLTDRPSGAGDLSQFTRTFNAVTIASSSGAVRTGGNTVTIKTTAAHGLRVGDSVAITGITDSANFAAGTKTVASVTGAFTFTYTESGSNVSSGNGTATQTSATSNYQAVDEVAHDGDASYVADSTAGHKDLYAHTGISATGTLMGVVVHTVMEKDDTATRQATATVRSDPAGTPTDADGTTHSLSQGSYTGFADVFETDPDTSAAWTVSGWNAAQFGVKCVA